MNFGAFQPGDSKPGARLKSVSAPTLWRYLLVPHDEIAESKQLTDILRFEVVARKMPLLCRHFDGKPGTGRIKEDWAEIFPLNAAKHEQSANAVQQ